VTKLSCGCSASEEFAALHRLAERALGVDLALVLGSQFLR
jgi:hypothetical protein